MPSVSKAQQGFMGAELARKRAGKATQTGMSTSQLSDFASTKTSKLPQYKKTPRRGRKIGGSKGPKARSSSLRGYKVT